MFESLRQAFREAVDNFHTELNRDRVPEAADRLLRAMEGELVDTRARLSGLESEIQSVEQEAAREEEAARTCLRREELALQVPDEETAAVARDYAARHLRRKDVLDEKARVLRRELADRRRELDEMTSQLKEARARRNGLAATAGRTGAREQIQEADDLFGEMDRMAERIEEMESGLKAEQEVADFLDPSSGGGDGSRSQRESDEERVEAQLAELKRRMSRE